MNFRMYSIALLASAIPLIASAGKTVSLDKGDFRSAKKIERNGDEVVSVKLSKSGKAKLRKLSRSHVNHPVHAEIGGVASDFTLRDPIQADGLEMGPYSDRDAQKVVQAINEN